MSHNGYNNEAGESQHQAPGHRRAVTNDGILYSDTQDTTAPNTIPKITIQRNSRDPATEYHTLTDLSSKHESLRVSGSGDHAEHSTWNCCNCQAVHKIYKLQQEHPLGVLMCVCLHKPCDNCAITGLVKQFEPIEEPAVVPIYEKVKKGEANDEENGNGNSKDEANVRFGVICKNCGLSWRAADVGRFKKKMRKVPSLSVLKGGHGKHVRKSKSTDLLAVPGSGSDSTSSPTHVSKAPISPPTRSPVIFKLCGTKSKCSQSQEQSQSMSLEQQYGEQAEFARVKFSGITCTCGCTTDLSSFCFQIVDPPKDFYQAQFEERMARPKKVGWSTTPELEAKGHGEPVIKTRRGPFPNPLRSNPVTEEDLEMVAQIRKGLGND